jgi:hypothetical protein
MGHIPKECTLWKNLKTHVITWDSLQAFEQVRDSGLLAGWTNLMKFQQVFFHRSFFIKLVHPS